MQTINQNYNYHSRDHVLEIIKRLGDRACCYGGGEWPDERRCDCKYTVPQDGSVEVPKFSGEGTGCPEMRAVYKAVSSFTDEQWSTLLSKQGIKFTSTDLWAKVLNREVRDKESYDSLCMKVIEMALESQDTKMIDAVMEHRRNRQDEVNI